MAERIQSEKLAIQHIGERCQGMPHIKMRIENPAKRLPCYSGFYNWIFRDVSVVVIIDKAIVTYRFVGD
jgi:hypothetical protein